MEGLLQLEVDRRYGRSVLVQRAATPPFHIGVPAVAGGQLDVVIQGIGPGLMPGDSTTARIDARGGAILRVRNQGAQRIHGRAPAVACRTSVTIRAADRSTVIYDPGETIPFAGAHVEQRTRIEIEGTGRVALLEILTPGRDGMGERGRWHRLDLRLQAWVDRALVLQERNLSQPDVGSVTRAGVHGDLPIAGTLYLVGPSWTGTSALADGPVVCGVGVGNGFTIVRMLGRTAQEMRAFAHEIVERCMAMVQCDDAIDVPGVHPEESRT